MPNLDYKFSNKSGTFCKVHHNGHDCAEKAFYRIGPRPTHCEILDLLDVTK